MSRTTVKIPQVLNAGLAASVYICLAQRIGNFLVDEGNGQFDPWVDMFVGTQIFLWNTKNFVDDSKSFEHEPDAGFDLGSTVIFSALAYTALSIGASSLFKQGISICILAGYFSILSLWSLNSFVRRRKYDDGSVVARERLERRRIWAISYAVCAALLLVAGCSYNYILIGAAAIVTLIIFYLDCGHSKTFSSHDMRGT